MNYLHLKSQNRFLPLSLTSECWSWLFSWIFPICGIRADRAFDGAHGAEWWTPCRCWSSENTCAATCLDCVDECLGSIMRKHIDKSGKNTRIASSILLKQSGYGMEVAWCRAVCGLYGVLCRLLMVA